ncbi:hypothetical protein Droror1_Dr00024339, partial [Drosera rotundifolia]
MEKSTINKFRARRTSITPTCRLFLSLLPHPPSLMLPAELETLLVSHPLIANATVV